MKIKIFILFCFLCEVIFAQWTDGQNASLVAGQANYTSSGSGTTSTTYNGTHGIAVDVTNGKIYVCDGGNNRVLRYSLSNWTSNQPTAELVFGQANLTSGWGNRLGACGQNTLYDPKGIAVDASGRLWVVDYSNQRVVWYNSAHTAASNGPNADGVLGQTNYTGTTGGTTASTFNNPRSITISSNDVLFVSDYNNNRVLRFDNASTLTPGTNNANGVLGQANFTSSSSGTTSTTMNNPNGVCISGTTLWVADRSNQRVLRFNNAASASDGQAADGVLGQANFTSSVDAVTQAGMDFPGGVTVDAGGRLYVSQLYRVTIYNDAANKANGANADNVIGQSNFTNSASACTQAGMASPIYPHVNGGYLYVSDNFNARVLRYSPSTSLPIELLSFSVACDKADENKIIAQWTTASEINNSHFDLEQSADMVNFTSVAKVDGAGNSTALIPYSTIVSRDATKGMYYRLKQSDYDGKSTTSPVISASDCTYKSVIKVTNNAFIIDKSNSDLTGGELFDVTGQLIRIYDFTELPAGINKFSIDDLPSAMYVLRLKYKEYKMIED